MALRLHAVTYERQDQDVWPGNKREEEQDLPVAVQGSRGLPLMTGGAAEAQRP